MNKILKRHKRKKLSHLLFQQIRVWPLLYLNSIEESFPCLFNFSGTIFLWHSPVSVLLELSTSVSGSRPHACTLTYTHTHTYTWRNNAVINHFRIGVGTIKLFPIFYFPSKGKNIHVSKKSGYDGKRQRTEFRQSEGQFSVICCKCCLLPTYNKCHMVPLGNTWRWILFYFLML